MKYTVVLEREPDAGFVASVPVLPGCVSQGNNRTEALANIREAIELYVEDCRLSGDPVPQAGRDTDHPNIHELGFTREARGKYCDHNLWPIGRLCIPAARPKSSTRLMAIRSMRSRP